LSARDMSRPRLLEAVSVCSVCEVTHSFSLAFRICFSEPSAASRLRNVSCFLILRVRWLAYNTACQGHMRARH
jgi:hypothetical protein